MTPAGATVGLRFVERVRGERRPADAAVSRSGPLTLWLLPLHLTAPLDVLRGSGEGLGRLLGQRLVKAGYLEIVKKGTLASGEATTWFYKGPACAECESLAA